MGNNEETKEIKFIGLWTPEYLAKDLLFPKPVDIQVAATKLKAWAHDVVFINKSDADGEIEKLKTEMQSWKDENFDNVESASETIKNLEQKYYALKEKADKLMNSVQLMKDRPMKANYQNMMHVLAVYKKEGNDVAVKNNPNNDYRIELHE